MGQGVRLQYSLKQLLLCTVIGAGLLFVIVGACHDRRITHLMERSSSAAHHALSKTRTALRSRPTVEFWLDEEAHFPKFRHVWFLKMEGHRDAVPVIALMIKDTVLQVSVVGGDADSSTVISLMKKYLLEELEKSGLEYELRNTDAIVVDDIPPSGPQSGPGL